MDFKYIVETNEAYNEKNLTETDRAFIYGIEYVKDDVIHTFLANYEVTDENDEMSTLDKIKKEIVIEAMIELKAWLESETAGLIVCRIDSYED